MPTAVNVCEWEGEREGERKGETEGEGGEGREKYTATQSTWVEMSSHSNLGWKKDQFFFESYFGSRMKVASRKGNRLYIKPFSQRPCVCT